VHVPGRPRDPAGVKALAIAAKKCFESYRPAGMRVHAGSIILEPGLSHSDFAEMQQQGVWLAKAGFGAFATPYDYAPYVAMAREHGMVSMVHTGGSSIPGSAGIWADHLLKIRPDVSYHVNGGPIAMPDEDFPRLVNESSIALQVCTAGNLRTTLRLAKLLSEGRALERMLIATDTPTGSGIMPLGMLYTISHLVSLGGIEPDIAVAMATGNNARVYRLNSGVLAPGRDADVILVDACRGGSQNDALSALRNGDIMGVGAVISAGIPRFVGRSRNTPETVRRAKVAHCRILQTFTGEA
jgi:enamidase